jgi:hypothetical protein
VTREHERRLMLIAATTRDGRRLLVLGLMDENVKRLLDDKPIYKDMSIEGVPGLEEWDVTILGPEDTARFVAHYAGAR